MGVIFSNREKKFSSFTLGFGGDRMKDMAVLEVVKLHHDAWAYAVAYSISPDFRPAFNKYFPFDEQ